MQWRWEPVPDLDRQIAALPHPERVHRIGYRSDAPALAAASDVVALTTTIPEGLPRSVLEAMEQTEQVGRPGTVRHEAGTNRFEPT